jgi:PAS domain S-box-containing protein
MADPIDTDSLAVGSEGRGGREPGTADVPSRHGSLAETETQLADSVRELEDIRYALDQSAIVATTDVTGRIKSVNEKFCEISKYSRAELLGQDHRILNSEFHPKEFIRELWRTIAQGRVWRGELRNRAKDGSLYWVDTTIVPFLDARGKPWQYMAIRYDITQRKQQEERLREQSALARLGEMAAVVAHEVRNPLAGIRGALQVISTRFPAGATEVRIMGDVVARIDSLSGTLDDLLMFARPREPKMVPLAVDAFLADVATWLKQDKSMGNVQVDVDAAGAVICADSEQLRLVLTNLLLNAAQAMECRGRIRLSAHVEGRRCEMIVHDSGPGMPEEVRARAFEPFYTTKTRGTGLGLPTVKRIVEAHHGTIAVECPDSGGTLVRILLPASAADGGTSPRSR